ncbi:hypothetical protein PM082_013668 [Marasmius tenuissimus]|nr:hypothetical protein PM082_013668 [Marasmius tenuissimus]
MFHRKNVSWVNKYEWAWVLLGSEKLERWSFCDFLVYRPTFYMYRCLMTACIVLVVNVLRLVTYRPFLTTSTLLMASGHGCHSDRT